MYESGFRPELLIAVSLPFIIMLAAMVGLKWSAFRAGGTALLVTLIGIPLVLDFNLPHLSADLFPGSLLESTVTSASILWIIGAALCIYYAQLKSGAMHAIQQRLSQIHPDPRISALFIAWFFSLFMEGAAGFGTSAALTAPFLVAAGYKPVIAVVLALWGHSLGVAFGAVGTPVISQAILLGIPEIELTQATLAYFPAATLVLATALAWGTIRFHNHSASLPSLPTRHVLLLGALSAVCFLVPALSLAWLTGPELPTLAGSLLGALLFIPLVQRTLAPPEGKSRNFKSTAQSYQWFSALAPYLVLIVLVLLTRLNPDVKSTLQAFAWHAEWRHYQVSIHYLYHPGSLLFVSFLVGALFQQQSLGAIANASKQAFLRILTVVPALLVMLLLSRLLVHSGSIHILGQQVTLVAGSTWPFWAPWFGVLGTFITGSATASNILFSEFQRTAAVSANVPVTPLLGGQTVGAAVGNMVCPHNIIAAGATVNLQGNEGQVMRYTLPIALVLSVIIGMTAWTLVR